MEFSKLKDVIPNDILDWDNKRNLNSLKSQGVVSFSQLIRAIKELDRPNIIVFEIINNAKSAEELGDIYIENLEKILNSIEQNLKSLFGGGDHLGLSRNIRILEDVITGFHSNLDDNLKYSVQEAIMDKVLDHMLKTDSLMDKNETANVKIRGIQEVIEFKLSLQSLYFRFAVGDIKKLWATVAEMIEKYKEDVVPVPENLEDKFKNPEIITDCINFLREESNCINAELGYIGGPKKKFHIIYWFQALQYHKIIDPSIDKKESVRLLTSYFEGYKVTDRTFRSHINENRVFESFGEQRDPYKHGIESLL